MKKLVFFLLTLGLTAYPLTRFLYGTEIYFFESKWGSYGSGDGQFYAPYGVAVDNSGNVYVADTSNYRIQKFSSTGTFITKWLPASTLCLFYLWL